MVGHADNWIAMFVQSCLTEVDEHNSEIHYLAVFDRAYWALANEEMDPTPSGAGELGDLECD